LVVVDAVVIIKNGINLIITIVRNGDYVLVSVKLCVIYTGILLVRSELR
jgi:hypothetical protein